MALQPENVTGGYGFIPILFGRLAMDKKWINNKPDGWEEIKSVWGMNSNARNVNQRSTDGAEKREAISALIHELQNHLHLATMEVELAQLGVEQRVDSLKLRRILESFRHSLHALRDCVLPSQNLTREDPMTILDSALNGRPGKNR